MTEYGIWHNMFMTWLCQSYDGGSNWSFITCHLWTQICVNLYSVVFVFVYVKPPQGEGRGTEETFDLCVRTQSDSRYTSTAWLECCTAHRHTHARTHVHTLSLCLSRSHAHMHKHTHTHALTHSLSPSLSWTHARTYTHACSQTHTQRHTVTHSHTHTHTHTHGNRQRQPQTSSAHGGSTWKTSLDPSD